MTLEFELTKEAPCGLSHKQRRGAFFVLISYLSLHRLWCNALSRFGFHASLQTSVFFIFNFSFLILIGCATNRSVLPQLPPLTSSTEFLRLVASRYDSLRDQEIRATIDLTIDGVRERRASALVRHKKTPSELKMVIGGLGIVVMSARAQNDTLHVHLPRENHYVVGQSEEVLNTLTGVDLSYYAVDHAILGLPNLTPLDAPRVIRFEPGRENILLELRHPFYLRRLWIEARTGLLHEEKIYNPDGQIISMRRLSDYRNENGFALPRHIEIHQGQNIIRIDIKSRNINPGFSHKDFDLRVPSDVTRYDVAH